MSASGGVLFPPGIFLDERPFSYGRLSEKKLRRELECVEEAESELPGR